MHAVLQTLLRCQIVCMVNIQHVCMHARRMPARAPPEVQWPTLPRWRRGINATGDPYISILLGFFNETLHKIPEAQRFSILRLDGEMAPVHGMGVGEGEAEEGM